jgi:hypothetical protein
VNKKKYFAGFKYKIITNSLGILCGGGVGDVLNIWPLTLKYQAKRESRTARHRGLTKHKLQYSKLLVSILKAVWFLIAGSNPWNYFIPSPHTRHNISTQKPEKLKYCDNPSFAPQFFRNSIKVIK